MSRLRMQWLGALAGALLVAPLAQAQSDREVGEQALAQSARICPGHSTERTGPAVRALPVGALRVLAQRDYTLCPDRRLPAETPVAWYGQAGVFAWNPDAPNVVKLLTEKVGAMTRSEEFPTATMVWNANGEPARNVTVPAFEPRARPVGR